MANNLQQENIGKFPEIKINVGGIIMKKVLSLFVAFCCAFSLVACGTSAEPQIPDLTGGWKQVNTNSADSYQQAVIQGDTIEIYWVSNGGDTKSLYWAGTFVAPTTPDEPYLWDSVNDTERTRSALLASGDETKTFTYEKNQISYSVSAFGTTTTMRLEKQQDYVPKQETSSQSKVPEPEPDSASTAENANTASSAGDVQEVFDITITLPADIVARLGSVTQESLDSNPEALGAHSAILNADGSITLTMSKAQQEEKLSQLGTSYQELLQGLVDGGDYPEVTNIVANENFTEFTVTTTNEKQSVTEIALDLSLRAYGVNYGIFAGTNVQTKDVKVTFINAVTGADVSLK